jgi:hypothetical protein
MTKCHDEKMKAQAAVEAAQAALVDLSNKEAKALAAAEKQKADAEKKRVDAVLFEISDANGLVCKCRIPTAGVAQRGLFRILLGSSMAPSTVSNVQQKSQSAPMIDWMMGSQVLPTGDLSGSYLDATTTTIKVSTDVA